MQGQCSGRFGLQGSGFLVLALPLENGLGLRVKALKLGHKPTSLKQ